MASASLPSAHHHSKRSKHSHRDAASHMQHAGPSTHAHAHTHKKNKHRKSEHRAEGKKKHKAGGKGDAVDSAFRFVSTDVRLSIPPVFGTDLLRGVEEMLDSLVMRWVDRRGGMRI